MSDFTIREIEFTDCHDIWEWRNHPEVRKWCWDSKVVDYDKHKKWYNKLKVDPLVRFYIMTINKKEKIGQARFDLKNRNIAWINVNLNPAFFNKGFGNIMIKKTTEAFVKEISTIHEVVAEIFDENIASKKAFEKAGYIFKEMIKKKEKKVAVYHFVRSHGDCEI